MTREYLLALIVVAQAARLAELQGDNRQAHAKEMNARRQARFRARKKAQGLVPVPAFVSLDSRPEMWLLGQAFAAASTLWFDAAAGSLKDRDGRHQQPNTRVSPRVVLEQSVDGKFPSRAQRIAAGQVKPPRRRY